VPTVMEEQERADMEDDELRQTELFRKKEREGPERWVSSGRGAFFFFLLSSHIRPY
jgi:hypothetical protein